MGDRPGCQDGQECGDPTKHPFIELPLSEGWQKVFVQELATSGIG